MENAQLNFTVIFIVYHKSILLPFIVTPFLIIYSFDFCQVEEGMADKNPPENLGQVVFGERLRASPYIINYRENKTFSPLCEKKYDFTKEDDRNKLSFIISRIQEGYMYAWVIDNMPVTWCYKVLNTEKQFCTPRFPMGCYVSKDGTRQESCYISVKSYTAGHTCTRVCVCN